MLPTGCDIGPPHAARSGEADGGEDQSDGGGIGADHPEEERAQQAAVEGEHLAP